MTARLPRRGARLAAATFLLSALAGCAALPAGPSPTTPLASGAPRVSDPRDLRGTRACAILAPDELRRFRVDPSTGTSEDWQQTEICRYHSLDNLDSFSVTTAFRWNPGGMDRLYRNRQFAELFETGMVDGFPTLIVDSNAADICDLNVGVADDQLLIVSVTKSIRSTAPHACDQARAIASAVIAHLPPLR